jgi:SSS family solute:Na+ symporter
MAIGLGVFALIIIFATLCIGMYGAVNYPDLNTADFITQVLIADQSNVVAAFAILGLIAAAISTSDSQIFALGGELRSLLTGQDLKMLNITRIAIVFFALVVFIFSLLTSDELVLLARTSFTGTALMAPMIFAAIFSERKLKMDIPVLTSGAMLVFMGSLLGIIPEVVLGLRIDLLLLILLTLAAFFSNILNR